MITHKMQILVLLFPPPSNSCFARKDFNALPITAATLFNNTFFLLSRALYSSDERRCNSFDNRIETECCCGEEIIKTSLVGEKLRKKKREKNYVRKEAKETDD